jgi:hypothetical protein
MSVILLVAGGYVVLASVVLVLMRPLFAAAAHADRQEEIAPRSAVPADGSEQPASRPVLGPRTEHRMGARLSAGVMAVAQSIGPVRSHPR